MLLENQIEALPLGLIWLEIKVLRITTKLRTTTLDRDLPKADLVPRPYNWVTVLLPWHPATL